MSNFFKWIYFKVLKWKLVGEMPKIDKMILPVIPHTHWNDFLMGIIIRNVINERINFVGNRAYSDRRLRRVLGSKQAGLLRRFTTRDTMVSERIALDKRLLSEFYLERGFADFKIYDVNAELSEEKDGFFISYNIKEGPKFSFGKIEISSELNEIDVANFRKLIKINSGDVYSPNSAVFEIE